MGKLTVLRHLALVLMPEGLVARLTRRRPTYRGKMIDPKAFAVGQLVRAMSPIGEVPQLEEGRQRLRDVAQKFEIKQRLVRVADISVDGAEGPLKARLFSDTKRGLQPAMVFFHGGGFVRGDIDSHHHTCAKLAKWSGYTVISVDYRLAPEHPFPAAPNDCVAAFLSVIASAEALGVDPVNTGVGGDSAGGCLAAVTAQQLAMQGGPKAAFQVLIYPVVNGNLTSASVADMPDDYVLPTDVLDYFLASYLGAWTDKNDALFSPIFGTGFAELPEAYILNAGFDPLVDDGKAYADKLEAAGVAVTYKLYPGQIHGFISLTKVIPQGGEALRGIANWLQSRI
jgi:acetyl esterase